MAYLFSDYQLLLENYLPRRPPSLMRYKRSDSYFTESAHFLIIKYKQTDQSLFPWLLMHADWLIAAGYDVDYYYYLYCHS